MFARIIAVIACLLAGSALLCVVRAVAAILRM